jgi:cytochrome c553
VSTRRAAAAALAIVTAGSAAAADVELGRHLAAECMTCHRAATASGAIPSISGMAEANFAVIVKAYRDRRLPSPVMQSIASRLTDEEIAALARYFATAPKP